MKKVYKLTILILLFLLFIFGGIIMGLTQGISGLNIITGIVLQVGTGISLCVLSNEWVEKATLTIVLLSILLLATFFIILGSMFSLTMLLIISVALIILVIATFFTMLFFNL